MIIGMFLFAKLVVENLAAQPSVDSLIDQLRPGNLPAGLDEALVQLPMT